MTTSDIRTFLISSTSGWSLAAQRLPHRCSTILVPKADELVANPYRHDGKEGAREFFEDGFRRVFARARETRSTNSRSPSTTRSSSPMPATTDRSTGWETLLDGMIRVGLGDHSDVADAQ